MATPVLLEDIELAELAIWARLGAEKARKYAKDASSFSVESIQLKAAEYREALAKRLEAARRRAGSGGSCT